ncbi:MAG: glycosyltransferase family 2 protein [Pseudomonadota bacterium]
MKISVITVCYNAQATIAYTLDSFLAQNHADKELLVIDGASTDGTPDIVKSFKSEQIKMSSEPDKGMYDALNKGLAVYTGDAVGVLHSDDTYHDKDALSRIAQALESADIVHGHLNFVDGHDKKRVVRHWRGEERPVNGFKTGWMPAHTTLHVRRHVAETVGPFDLSLKTASDYDWMIRAIDVHGFETRMIDHILVDMAEGGKSTAGIGAHIHHNLEALKARQRWLGTGVIDFALFAKPARKISQFFRPGQRSQLA